MKAHSNERDFAGIGNRIFFVLIACLPAAVLCFVSAKCERVQSVWPQGKCVELKLNGQRGMVVWADTDGVSVRLKQTLKVDRFSSFELLSCKGNSP